MGPRANSIRCLAKDTLFGIGWVSGNCFRVSGKCLLLLRRALGLLSLHLLDLLLHLRTLLLGLICRLLLLLGCNIFCRLVHVSLKLVPLLAPLLVHGGRRHHLLRGRGRHVVVLPIGALPARMSRPHRRTQLHRGSRRGRGIRGTGPNKSNGPANRGKAFSANNACVAEHLARGRYAADKHQGLTCLHQGPNLVPLCIERRALVLCKPLAREDERLAGGRHACDVVDLLS
mmetsp:Transcript_18374/g.47769  ORF Transcript_18374/g.47769 Transcript_18374/m.47769 type:complete len:230 (+) Transcript_18374:1-690(+)